MKKIALALAAALTLSPLAAPAAMQKAGKAPVQDVWKPAATPKGGVSWTLLESTKETQRRDSSGTIYSKPVFSPQVKTLHGKQIKVAGWMMPLENAARQKRFVLLAYPPGCPFHFHAMPNQFVEVLADVPVPLNERDPMVITGTLQLTGQDESGVFYRLVKARKT
jgi:uncharacterized protein